MNYEDNIKELEKIVDTLNNDLPMDKALETYQKGVSLITECLSSLENTKGSIYKVKQELDEFIQEKMK